MTWCCLRYCKSTIFQANHNGVLGIAGVIGVVCDTAKVRFFKQITTAQVKASKQGLLFAILQKYDFSSKSQLNLAANLLLPCCLRYCKSTIFQANHNINSSTAYYKVVVCDTAKVRFFKQITTEDMAISNSILLFAILQKYDFSSKSQLVGSSTKYRVCCLRYCKSTIFQANHNFDYWSELNKSVVCDTAKVRFFKQITTCSVLVVHHPLLFAILQKYDFSSKSQPLC